MACAKPCKKCPFNKKANLNVDELGGSHPTVYVGQAYGAFFLACHAAKGYDVEKIKAGDFTQTQCAGAAVYRANAGHDAKLPDALLKADKDPEQFQDAYDFLAFYLGEEQATYWINQVTEYGLYLNELQKLNSL